MKLDEDYKFRDDIKSDTVPVELIGGAWSGVVVSFTAIKIVEQEDETARITFGYKLHRLGPYTETQLRGNKPFETYIGLLLNSFLLEVAEAPEQNENANREGDSEELGVEPGLPT